MKRREDIVEETNNLEPVQDETSEEVEEKETETAEPEVVLENPEDDSEIKVVNKKLVDEEGFAISDSEIEDESEKTNLFVEVDGLRQNYLKSAKFFKFFNIGVMVVMLIAVVSALAVMANKDISKNQTAQIALIVTIIVLLIGIFIYNICVKRHLNSKASEYVAKYYEVTTKYMLDFDDVTLVTVNPKGKVDKEFFNNSRLYKGIQGVGSRNVVSFKHKERDMMFVDLAAQIQGVKKLEPVFVGKVLKYKTSKSFNGRLIAQIKGTSKLTKPINDIDGLEEVASTNHYVVYSNMNKANTYLTKTITDLFAKYKLGNDLLDVVISLHDNEIIVGLDYNDHVMSLPVDKKFNKKQIDDIQDSLKTSLRIVEEIADKLE